MYSAELTFRLKLLSVQNTVRVTGHNSQDAANAALIAELKEVGYTLPQKWQVWRAFETVPNFVKIAFDPNSPRI